MLSILHYLLIGVFLFICMLSDIRTYRVSHILYLSFYISGNVYFYLNDGLIELLLYHQRLLLCLVVLYWLYRIRFFGAADIKLLAIVCGYLGYKAVSLVLLFALLSAAILSLVKIILNRNYYQRKAVFMEFLQNIRKQKKLVVYPVNKTQNDSLVPFAACIFSGFCCYLLLIHLG